MLHLCELLRRDHIHLGCRDAAACHLAHLKTSAHVQSRSRLFKVSEGNPGIHQCAQQHVTANAGKAFQISNTHRE